MNKEKMGKIVKYVCTLIAGILAGNFIIFAFSTTPEGDTKVDVIIADTPSAKVEDEEGEYEIDVATVEEVDSDEVVDEMNEEESGQGSVMPTDTPWAFRDAALGKCEDTDLHYGGQCWDLIDSFYQNELGRRFSTCGTGAAKGTIKDGCWQINAGDDFEMVWNPEELQVGDIVVFTNGQFGHVGMAMGNFNNGYITLLGQNQGGIQCSGGGAQANIINISTKNFGGAFRLKRWHKTETPEVDLNQKPCTSIEVQEGDTMSSIMARCEGEVDWSKMNDYAKSWKSEKVKPDQSVYDGWHSETGVGLYAGDVIVRI